ncbi:hypothetical protein [Halobacillus halophilus]|uniref:hypothetical protein n=1 Tax=Halobacillus halophilus TaxID=1570 RepID=UPI001CD1C8D8|nr:hypothetical protein [Halobacillus halophilus]MCA1012820.1 hypothetical protein [Halobacillus halophilus]
MDLDSLLTTVITSTAALVAIIGGFLVSRVISISSEQSSVKRKLREFNNDIKTKEDLLKQVETYLFQEDLNDFIDDDDAIKGLIKGNNLEKIVQETEYDSLPLEKLRLYFEQLLEIKNEIVEGGEATLEEFKEKNAMKYPEREKWYERIYEVFGEMVEAQSSTVPGWMSGFKTPAMVSSEYNDKKKELARLKEELTVLRTQRKEQESILKEYGQPKYVMSGLIVLAYAAVVGIIYPSTLMPYPMDTYDDVTTKWWILSLFFSHIFVIFSYLFIAMKKLGGIEEN